MKWLVQKLPKILGDGVSIYGQNDLIWYNVVFLKM